MAIGTLERIAHLCSRIRTRLFTLLLCNEFKEFGAGARIVPPFRFYGLNSMSVGEGVMINRDCWLQTVCHDARDGEAKLVIRSHADLGMGAHISAARQVVIGERVLFGRNVYISDHAHAYRDIEVPIMSQGIDGIAPVSIGSRTWLGQNVVVLPGVTIGEHCVIGANSVVNSFVPGYSVAAGAPARVVRHFNPDTRMWERTAPEKSH